MGLIKTVNNWDARPLGKADGFVIALEQEGGTVLVLKDLNGIKEYVRPEVYLAATQWSEHLDGSVAPGDEGYDGNFAPVVEAGGLIESVDGFIECIAGSSINQLAYIVWDHGTAPDVMHIQGTFAASVVLVAQNNAQACVMLENGSKRLYGSFSRDTAERFALYEQGVTAPHGLEVRPEVFTWNAPAYLEMLHTQDFVICWANHDPLPFYVARTSDLGDTVLRRVALGNLTQGARGNMRFADVFVGMG